MNKAKGILMMLLAGFMALSVTSCLNDELRESQLPGAGKIADVEEQAAAIEASLADIEALQNALGQNSSADLERSAEALENHIADLRDGAAFIKGTMTTLQQQKNLAEAVGTIAASDEDGTLKKQLATLEKGVKAWLGKLFTEYYPAAVAESKVAASISGLDLKTQKLNVEGILSDVEAGLRKAENPEEISELAMSVNANFEEAESLLASLSAIVVEIESEYIQTVETAVAEPDNFDAPALKQFNAKVASELSEADNSLAGLIARVQACEAQLQNITDRLEALETRIEDVEALLGMIQSVTFMSEYSSDKAVALYTMNTDGEADEQGRKPRTSAGSMTLRYVVRPASAAEALAEQTLWNNGLKVFGYYAAAMTRSSDEFFDFNITGVTADKTTGIVTLTVGHSLSNEFFMKETGAKLALSVATGKADLTSKFVEIVPMDQSGTVYAETLELSEMSIEIDNGQTAQLTAKIAPDDVTTPGVIWTSNNNDVLTVSSEGVVTAKAVGNAVVTATSNSVDEWGRTLTASCSVKVNPSIKISGPNYVEAGGTVELRVESPDYIDPQYIKWESSHADFASVESNNGVGVVTGKNMWFDVATKEYQSITITCTIDGAMPVVLEHKLRVVAVQPLGISINGLSDLDTQVSTKVGRAVGLYATIKPETVSADYFKIVYSMNCPDGYFPASSVGTYYVNISIENGGTGQYSYFYPKGKELSKTITVNVEPYWVERISLPETMEMSPGQTASLTAEFASDVEGVQPTYKDLVWTSSAPDIVSINETTGEMTAHVDGIALITASTSNSQAVPNGAAQKSATCQVTVKTPTKAINVGDYFYSDGDWSSELIAGKTVIGIVFSTTNAVAADPILLRDAPKCTNGLVLGLSEYESAFGYYKYAGGYNNSIYEGGIEGYGAVLSEDKPTGYGLTLAYGAYREKYKADSDYETACVLFDTSTGPAALHNAETSSTRPSSVSQWYIPSKIEMTELYNNKSKLNESLRAVSGTEIGDDQYWSAYLYNKKVNEGSKYNDCYSYTINMSDGNWTYESLNTNVHKVRVVLAF